MRAIPASGKIISEPGALETRLESSSYVVCPYLPMEANASDVRSHARNVRSNRVISQCQQLVTEYIPIMK